MSPFGVFVVLGPILGALPYIALFLITWRAAALFVAIWFYPCGIIPAVIAGAAFRLLLKRVNLQNRKVWTFIAGAMCGVCGCLPILGALLVAPGTGGGGVAAMFLAPSVLSGGLCGLIATPPPLLARQPILARFAARAHLALLVSVLAVALLTLVST